MIRANGGDVARRCRRPITISSVASAVSAVVALAVVPALAAPAPVARQAGNPCSGVVDEVLLSGSTSAQIAVTTWGAAICAEADVIADTINTGSKGGRDAVIAGTATVGLTSLPFTEEEEAALVEAERGVVMIPVIASAAICTYWDRGRQSSYPHGTGYPNLRLSRRTVGLMLAGRSLDTFGDGPPPSVGDSLAEDNADNPDYPTEIARNLGTEFYVRSGYSAVTYEVGRWVAQDPDAVADFELESSQRYQADLPFEEMPNLQSDAPRIINDYSGMAKQMVESPGGLGVGCMDGATARTDARPENPGEEILNQALLENRTGLFVAATNPAVSAAIAQMVPEGDGTFAPAGPLGDDADPDEVEAAATAYAMPLVVYAAVPTCGYDPELLAATGRLLDYMVGPGQRALPPGNVPLVGAVAQTATRQLAAWKDAAVPRACGEEAPTANPPPADPPTDTAPRPGEPATGAPPFVPPTDAAPPPFDPGVQPDPGFAPSGGGDGLGGLGPSGLGGDAGGGAPATGPGEEAATGPTGTPPAASAEDEGPLDPVARIVAMAQGSAAVPPLALILAGVLALVVGPALQTADGLSRASSLPGLAKRWFSRLRP